MSWWEYILYVAMGIILWNVAKKVFLHTVVYRTSGWFVKKLKEKYTAEESVGTYSVILFPGAEAGPHICFYDRNRKKQLGVRLGDGILINQDVISVADPATGEITTRTVME